MHAGLDDLARLLGRGLDTGADALKRAGQRVTPGDITRRQPMPGGDPGFRRAPAPPRPPSQPQVRAPAPWGRRALGAGVGVGAGFGLYEAGKGLGRATEEGGIAGAFTGSSPQEGGALGGLLGDDGQGGIGGALASALPLLLLAGGGYLVYRATRKGAKA